MRHVLPPEITYYPVAPQSPPSWLWGFSCYAKTLAESAHFSSERSWTEDLRSQFF